MRSLWWRVLDGRAEIVLIGSMLRIVMSKWKRS